MKVSVSLPDEDLKFIDAYAREQGHSRSSALQRAVAMLRAAQLGPPTPPRSTSGSIPVTPRHGKRSSETASADAQTGASAGMTEAQARAAGHDVVSRVLELENVPRALANRDTRGAIKMVADAATGKVLGVHALAEGAGDLILAGVYAIKFGRTVDDLATTLGALSDHERRIEAGGLVVQGRR